MAANKEELIFRGLILSAHSELESTLQACTSIHT
jgi:membrane protease YdiL (CAAX protease family)